MWGNPHNFAEVQCFVYALPAVSPGSSWVRSSVIVLNCHAMSYFEHTVQRLIISQRQRVTRPQCGGGGKDPCSLGSPSPGARCSIHLSCLGYPRPTLHFTPGHSKVCLVLVHCGVLCFWIPCLSAPWETWKCSSFEIS